MRAPSWDDLHYLLEAVRQGSLSAGARALGVDHATIGRRIRRLERVLGRAVIDRQRPGLVLTAFGEAALTEAERMRDAAATIARLAEARPKLAGPVRITTTGMLATVYLTPALASLRKQQPLIDIALIVDERSLSLARREADIALRLARPKDGTLVARRVATIGYGFYATRRYLRRTQADALAFVGFEENPPDFPEVGWLHQAAQHRPIAFRSNSRMALVEAVRAGFGIGVLPHYAAMGLVRAEMIATPSEMTRELWLLVHRDLKDAPRFRAVIDFLVERLARDRGLFGKAG
ncbi:LysR family transcriptional regulator [Dongia sedimenti]|uniref:LysR family transcriptional regulator n=1 Tax=Dongia sedimenti TaxID=3064282 RepID=A0ABU0YMK0_9PROT|nr:LysR family transcriptional regulator [Rhodospirillaceae bacterium R-7]